MAIGFLNRGTDYTQVDRFRSQLMDAVNRQIQYETSITAAEKDAQQRQAIGSILTDYANDIAPKAGPSTPGTTLNVPTGLSTQKLTQAPILGMPFTPTIATGGVDSKTLDVPGVAGQVEEPSRELQYNAAMKAFSRLSQYGKAGLDIGKQIQDNLTAYAQMFPFQKPVHSEELLTTTQLKSPTGDTADVLGFGYKDPKTGKNIITDNKIASFGFPPAGSTKGDSFYGGFFTYGDPAHPELPTGINQDLDQKERMKLDAQINVDEGRYMNSLNQNETHLETMVAANGRMKALKLQEPYSQEAIQERQKLIAETKKNLFTVQRHREILRGTGGKGKSGGELDKGGGIRKPKAQGH